MLITKLDPTWSTEEDNFQIEICIQGIVADKRCSEGFREERKTVHIPSGLRYCYDRSDWNHYYKRLGKVQNGVVQAFFMIHGWAGNVMCERLKCIQRLPQAFNRIGTYGIMVAEVNV